MTEKNPTRWQIYTAADPTVERIIPALAKEIGLNESIVLMQIAFWINGSNNVRENTYWTYNSLRDMQREYFPYWGVETLRRTIKNLQKRKFIMVRTFNKRKGDNTQWFALVPDTLSSLKSVLVAPAIEGEGVSKWDTPSQDETPQHQNETTLPKTSSENTQKKERRATSKKKNLTELEVWQRRLQTVEPIASVLLAKFERAYDPAFQTPMTYMTLSLLKKYVPYAEELTFLKMTPELLLSLCGEIEPEYKRQNWTFALKTIGEKAPSFMARLSKTPQTLPPLSIVPPPVQPVENITPEQRQRLADESLAKFLAPRQAVVNE